MGRTAPVLTNGVKSAAAASSSASTKPTQAPKGCGRADCCQLPNGTNKATKKFPQFPQHNLRPYTPHSELIFPPSLRRYQRKSLKFGDGERVWLRPTSLKELVGIVAMEKENLKEGGRGVKLVGGSSEIQIEVKVRSPYFPILLSEADR